MRTEIFQTPDSSETVVVIKDDDGSIAIGIARAGFLDKKRRMVTSEDGIKVATGRAYKARTYKKSFCKKNYLRAFYGNRIQSE